MKRDIIVVGASAGGVEVLQRLCQQLPADLPASVFVVLHVGGRTSFAEILDRNGPLPAKFPFDGEIAAPGHIYVAPAEHHMEYGEKGIIRLLRGPRDNGHRPSIDVLFRSAARVGGPRVTGAILSGALDDGVAGLFAIKARGGVTLVQDPGEAIVPDMPRNALKYVQIDFSLPIDKLAPKLVELSMEDGSTPSSTAAHEKIPDTQTEETGTRFFPVACPECNGPIFETRDGDFSHFACFVGHTYSPESFSQAHNQALERALWTALRRMNERLEMHKRIIERGTANEAEMGMIRRFGESIEQTEKEIQLLREVLEHMI